MIEQAENPQRWARMAGALYLLIIALGLFGELFTRGALVVPGDPAATAARISDSMLLWRLGIAGCGISSDGDQSISWIGTT